MNLSFCFSMCEISGYTPSSPGKKKDGNRKILPIWIVKKLETQISFHHLTCEGSALPCPPGL